MYVSATLGFASRFLLPRRRSPPTFFASRGIGKRPVHDMLEIFMIFRLIRMDRIKVKVDWLKDKIFVIISSICL